MFRFTRIIRRKLLENNRLTKYLLYAVGEIVLVVIGILIALAINNRNEQKSIDQSIQAVLKEVQKDILNDLDEIDRMSKNYLIVDERTSIILDMDDPLTLEKLQDERLRNIGSFIDYLKIDRAGYDNLMSRNDQLTEPYFNLRQQLQFLYQRYAEFIDLSNEHLRNVVEDQYAFLQNTTWKIDRMRSGSIPKAQMDYYLSDEYLNYILNYRRERYDLFRDIQTFRRYAIQLHDSVDVVLKRSDFTLPSGFRYDVDLSGITQWMGIYKRQSPEQEVRIYSKPPEVWVEINHPAKNPNSAYPLERISDSLFTYHDSQDKFLVLKSGGGNNKHLLMLGRDQSLIYRQVDR